MKTTVTGYEDAAPRSLLSAGPAWTTRWATAQVRSQSGFCTHDRTMVLLKPSETGFYMVTPLSPGQWQKSFRMHSLRLAATAEPKCLSFW